MPVVRAGNEDWRRKLDKVESPKEVCELMSPSLRIYLKKGFKLLPQQRDYPSLPKIYP